MWQRLASLWSLWRSELRHLWRALQHPQSPAWLRWACAALVLYIVVPLDLVPDAIPLLGWVDDVVIVGWAVRWLLRRLPPQVRADVTRGPG